MHFKNQIETRTNFTKEQLEIAFSESFYIDNQIDDVLLRMESISSLIIDKTKGFAIYGVDAGGIYFLFTLLNTTIKCQIEIYSNEANLSEHFRTIYSSLENIQRKLLKHKFIRLFSSFMPLRIYDGNGNDTGLTVSKISFYESLKKCFSRSSTIELFAILTVIYIFTIWGNDKYIEGLIPSLTVGLIVFFVKAVKSLLTEFNSIQIKGANHE